VTLTEIKELIQKNIYENKDEIIRLGEEVLDNPEIGYCEENTSSLVRKTFDELEIEYEYPLALTGVKAKLKGKSSKYNVCIIGEMDALQCAGHPKANNLSIAHACGHNTQVAAMLGCAIALKKSGIMKELDGDITFFAVPAEEFIDLDYRKNLKNDGKIKFFGGKQQLIYEGAFDDVDIAFMIHAQPDEKEAKLYVQGGNLGFLAKTITFQGKAAHGSTPFYGTNALNAAALSILGIHSNRETFRDEDRIRIHPIITKGGDVVNSVPDEVCIDTYVRGATFEAIQKGNKAVERSITGAAQMIGAEVSSENIPGYLPLRESMELSEIFENNASEILGKENLVYNADITGSSDIGDLSSILPVVQPSIGGFSGLLHGKDFTIHNKETVYILPALIMAYTAAELLYEDAKKAEYVVNNFKPEMTKQEYINYLKGE